MRDLNAVAISCEKMLDAIGIPYIKPVAYIVNTRAKERWGQCKYVGKFYSNGKMHYKCEININQELLMETTPIRSLEATILHELLHTCDDCHDHKKVWKAYAAKVNSAYGYNIKRTASAAEKGLEPTPGKYLIRCKKCNRIVSRHRKTHFVEHCELWRCGVCGGNFERIK